MAYVLQGKKINWKKAKSHVNSWYNNHPEDDTNIKVIGNKKEKYSVIINYKTMGEYTLKKFDSKIEALRFARQFMGKKRVIIRTN